MILMQFIKAFLKHPTKTGAIAPSSVGLSELITDTADLSEASAVIELGPGTGVFTEKIIQKIPEGTVFIAIELNVDFVQATRDRCPDVEIHHDSATNARQYLEAHDLDHCDCIICGLPWASFSESLQDDLLNTITDILRPGGRFLTFAYLQGLLLPAGQRFRKKLRSHFSQVTTTKTVWCNVPPAFVYCATK